MSPLPSRPVPSPRAAPQKCCPCIASLSLPHLSKDSPVIGLEEWGGGGGGLLAACTHTLTSRASEMRPTASTSISFPAPPRRTRNPPQSFGDGDCAVRAVPGVPPSGCSGNVRQHSVNISQLVLAEHPQGWAPQNEPRRVGRARLVPPPSVPLAVLSAPPLPQPMA